MTRDELNSLETYLRKTFQSDAIGVKSRVKKSDSAEVYVGENLVAFIGPDPDDDGDYQLEMDITKVPFKATLSPQELSELEKHLRETFRTDLIEVKGRPKKKDSAEVYVHEEFMALIYCGDEDGKGPYKFQMAILSADLENSDAE